MNVVEIIGVALISCVLGFLVGRFWAEIGVTSIRFRRKPKPWPAVEGGIPDDFIQVTNTESSD